MAAKVIITGMRHTMNINRVKLGKFSVEEQRRQEQEEE